MVLAVSPVFAAAIHDAKTKMPAAARKTDFLVHPAFALPQAAQPLLN
jgi:hypothetical protein